VVKKFDLPNVQPLTDVQRDNRMLDMVHQAVGQAFINHGPVMTRTVHNAVIGTISGSAGQGYMGSVYHQPSQFNFTPVGSATLTPPSASLPQPNGATLPPQTDTVFTSSPPITTTVPGGSTSGFPLGWDPVTRFGMPPEAFVPSSSGQKQHSNFSADGSATECVVFTADDPEHVSFTADRAEHDNAHTYGSS